MMRIGLIPLILAATLASTVLASAQGSGTAPEDKGNTGWTGGSRDQPSQSGQSSDVKPSETTGVKTEVHDEALAKDQPFEATGQDLKGPPTQFAPSKTPE
jgi:hypothetical protein